MKLGDALKKARIKMTTVSNKKLETYNQSPDTICFWLFEDKDSKDEYKKNRFLSFLESKDWKVDTY